MPDSQPIKSNVPEFSVSELAFSLKKTLEDQYGRVRVRGELSRVKIHSSGHMYTDLKDADSVINAVCWRGSVAKLSVKPEEGLEVICTGKISTYPARSNYQLIIDSMELAGAGALLKMLEERRKKLAAEGLFDAARKKKLPFLPEVIGVVTSPTGAVIQDILHRLADRFPRHVMVWPVLVQGPGAAEQVVAAINGFQTMTPRPDLLIVARGGGSLEDLMPFNEEIVVRAAANSTIPLISAVGHETDTTLIDYAADLRAPTPTGAAEMAVPVRADLRMQVSRDSERLFSGINRLVSELGHKLQAQQKGLGDPARLLEIKTQRLDRAGDKIVSVFTNLTAQKRERLLRAAGGLRHPRQHIEHMEKTFGRWAERLFDLAPNLTRDAEKRLGHAGKMLEAYSFENVLRRGYTVVRGADGAVITDAAQTKTGQAIEVQFRDQKRVAAEVK